MPELDNKTINRWKTVRVFISSTFRDMHAERDHLVRFVFPELKERCRKIHVHLIDVDLRWGVTEKDAQEGKALEICLDEIDTCRPYFLGLLGHRYGYVPPGHQHSITAQEIYHGVLHNDLPKQVIDLSKIIEGKLEGKPLSDEQRDTLMRCYVWDAGKRKYMVKEGITAEESTTIQSAFQQYAAYQKDRSFFFFRKESLTATLSGTNRNDFFEQSPEDRVKLEALKQEIRDAHLPWFEYDDIEAFGQLIMETLWKRIETEIGQEILAEKGWLEELEFHELFIAGLTRRFVGRRDLLDRMHGFLEHNDKKPILVVTGEPGCGKSALMARFSEEAKHQHPDWLIIPHFVGASPDSTIIRQVLRRVCMHIYNACDFDKQMQERISLITGNDEQAQKQRQEIQKEYTIPDDYKELAEKFPEFLGKASHSHRVLVILDAANQLDKSDDAHAMRWLPQPMSENVSFVISTPAGEVYDALMAQRAKPEVESMHGLEKSEIKEFVNDYLHELSKEFPNQEVADAFFEKVKNGNPLYIIVALEELRVFGRFEEVSSEIQKLPEDVPSLFGQMLERIERDYQPYPGLVRDCVSYIACGRYGMASEELQTLLKTHAPRLDPAIETVKLPDMLWARLYRTFGAYLINRAGVTDFFHTQLKDAVGRRYLSNEAERDRVHKTIADYFETRWREPYTRALSELPHQRTKASDWDGLETILCDLFFIEAKCKAGMTYELIVDYNLALDGLPEAQKEKEEKQKRDERMQRYIREMIEYAKKWNDARFKHYEDPVNNPMPKPEDIPLPEIIPSVRPWTDEEIDADTQRIINNPTRLDRIKLFSQFVNSEAHNFVKYASQPLFCIQQAYNSADAGQVASTACKILDNEKTATTLLRINNFLPKFNPHPACIRTLEGHTNVVGTVGLTQDGRCAVSGSWDRTLRVWDVEGGRCLSTLEGHTGHIYAVSLTPDGRLAVAGTEYGTLQVWDVKGKRCLHTLEGHTDWVFTVSLTPDGRLAVSGSTDGTFRVWDVEGGRCLRTFEGIGVVSLTPDGCFAVSGSRDGTLRVWNVESGQCLRTLEGHRDYVNAVSLTPDGRRAVSVSEDTSRVWDVEGGRCLHTLGNAGHIDAVSLTPDGRLAVSVSLYRWFQVWDVEGGRCLRTIEGNTSLSRSISLTPDGCRAVSVSDDGTLQVWDVESGRCPRTHKWYIDSINAVSLTPGGRLAVSVSGYGPLRVWDVESGQCLRTIEWHRDSINVVSITPDGRLAVSVSDDGTFRVWNVESGQCLHTLKVYLSIIGRTLSLTPDGRRAVTVSNDNAYHLWDVEGGRYLGTLEGQTSRSISLTPDGRRAVSSGKENEPLWVCDMESGRRLCTFERHTDYICAVSLAPDGRIAVSGSGDGSLQVWDIGDGKCLRTLKGYTYLITSLCLTPDGRLAVSVSDDGRLQVWSMRDGQCLRTLDDHKYLVKGVSLIPDGRLAILKCSDWTLRVWDMESWRCMALIVLSEPATDIKVAFKSSLIIFGDTGGNVSFVRMHNVKASIPIVSPVCLWLYGEDDTKGNWDSKITALCDWCGKRFVVSGEILDVIMTINRNDRLSPDDSPCLKLPQEAWNEPKLLSACPHCHQPLKFNPFVVDNRERY